LVLQWTLVARGRPLLIDPAIRISHLNETTTSAFCKGNYMFNVTFGAGWANAESWSRSRRALQALGIPWWAARRIVDVARTARARERRRALLRHFPTIVLSQSAAATGIAVGCILGDRDAARRFADYEIDADRGPATVAPLPSSS